MLRSCVVVLSISVVVLAVRAVRYDDEYEATVALLPNDLFCDEPIQKASIEQESSKQEPPLEVATPQQVIQNRLIKFKQTVDQAVENARRSCQEKQKLPVNYFLYTMPLLSLLAGVMRTEGFPRSPGQGQPSQQSGSGLLQPRRPLVGSGLSASTMNPLSEMIPTQPQGGVLIDLNRVLGRNVVPLRNELPRTSIVQPAVSEHVLTGTDPDRPKAVVENATPEGASLTGNVLGRDETVVGLLRSGTETNVPAADYVLGNAVGTASRLVSLAQR